MGSRTSLINRALSALGKSAETSPSMTSPAGKVAAERFEEVMDELLRAHEWSFGEHRENNLAPVADTAETSGYKRTASGMLYCYLKPTDPYCLKVRRIYDQNGAQPAYLTSGIYIETNAYPYIDVVYSKRIDESLESADAMFNTAFAFRLASEIAKRVTGYSREEIQVIDQKAIYWYNRATEMDSSEDNIPVSKTSGWLTARGSSGWGRYGPQLSSLD